MKPGDKALPRPGAVGRRGRDGATGCGCAIVRGLLALPRYGGVRCGALRYGGCRNRGRAHRSASRCAIECVWRRRWHSITKALKWTRRTIGDGSWLAPFRVPPSNVTSCRTACASGRPSQSGQKVARPYVTTPQTDRCPVCPRPAVVESATRRVRLAVWPLATRARSPLLLCSRRPGRNHYRDRDCSRPARRDRAPAFCRRPRRRRGRGRVEGAAPLAEAVVPPPRPSRRSGARYPPHSGPQSGLRPPPPRVPRVAAAHTTGGPGRLKQDHYEKHALFGVACRGSARTASEPRPLVQKGCRFSSSLSGPSDDGAMMAVTPASSASLTSAAPCACLPQPPPREAQPPDWSPLLLQPPAGVALLVPHPAA